MVLVSSISNFFTNKTSLANKWMSFSCSNLALVWPKIPKFICPICCSSPTVWDFSEKRLHLASEVRAPVGQGRSLIQTLFDRCDWTFNRANHCIALVLGPIFTVQYTIKYTLQMIKDQVHKTIYGGLHLGYMCTFP